MRRGRRNSRQLHNGPNFAMCCALLLLSMVCLSTYMLSGLHAKYTTSDSGGDNARVIKFGEISITEMIGGTVDSNGNSIMIPGVPMQRQALVNFGGSEAATYVFAEVMLSQGWVMTDAGDDLVTKNKSFSYDGGKLTFGVVQSQWKYLKSEVKDLEGGKTETKHVYYMEMNPNTPVTLMPVIAKANPSDTYGVIEVSSTITREQMNAWTAKDIYINIRASVVQSNGFASAEAAWESLNNH